MRERVSERECVRECVRESKKETERDRKRKKEKERERKRKKERPECSRCGARVVLDGEMARIDAASSSCLASHGLHNTVVVVMHVLV